MTKEKVIEQFVRRYYKLLKSRSDFQKKDYDNLKKSYFGDELKYTFQNPKDREIADCLVKMMIRANSIPDNDALRLLILETPFLKLSNLEAEDYSAEILKVSNAYKAAGELQGLNDYQKIQKLKEQAVSEATEDITRQIEIKKGEYKKLPSILEDSNFEEPQEVESGVEKKEWWQELNLKENPFPGALEGLSSLNKSLFNEIIVETQPIEWALKKLSSKRYDFFHQAILLGGEFGSGKTTFFDFISLHLLQHHIEPLRIAIMDQISEAHYVHKFEKELCREIVKVASKFGISHKDKIIDSDEMIVMMLEMQSRGVKGFFLFLDDLHKNSDRTRVFNFLAQLQIFKNNIRKESVNMVYIVSGFPGWRDRIKQDSALSGFFDAPEELLLPEVTPELAADAITRRLKAFAINPDKAFSVKEEFLRLIFKRVSSEVGRTNIGFRPYIKEAVKNFEERKFDILSVDYSKLDEKLATEIKQVLEEDYDFKDKINRLVFGGGIKKKQNRELTLKLLCEVYLRRGISEDEEIFIANKFAFKRLMEIGLINKAKKSGQLVWVISPELRDLNLSIIQKYNLSIEDYLVPIYIGIVAPKQINITKEESQSEIYFNDLLKWRDKLDSQIYAELQGTIDTYRLYLEPYILIDAKQRSLIGKVDAPKIKRIVWRLMKALVRFESPVLLDIPPEGKEFDWGLRHRTLEYISHFIQMEKRFVYNNPTADDIVRFIAFAVDSFDELWREFRKTIEVYSITLVKPFELPRTLLNYIYTHGADIFLGSLAGKEYFDALSNLTETIENILRSYLHVSCTLSFGMLENRLKIYPEDIKKYLVKGDISPLLNTETYNEFQNLNRGQYRQLFTQTSRNTEFYRVVIEPVIRQWDSKDIDVFFSLFGDLNIIISHQKTITAEEKTKDIPTFFRLSCRFVSNLCENLRNLMLRKNACFEDGETGFVVFGCQVVKGKDSVTHEKIVSRIATVDDTELINKSYHWHQLDFSNNFSKSNDLLSHAENAFGDIIFDMLDFEGMRIRYSEQFSKTAAMLCYLEAHGKLKTFTLYGSELCFRKL
jgi:hypothetical protein